jgi:GTP-binding protein Era
MTEVKHKAGFVSIIGKPNVGKSTLMNQLVGERISIITSKAQTTRHRIMGIISGEDFQIVYSDTPGMIKPAYELQSNMMKFVNTSIEDADVVLLVSDLFDNHDEETLKKFARIKQPIILIINKIDLDKNGQTGEKIQYWKSALDSEPMKIIPVSALEGVGIEHVFSTILENLPEHPPYFDKDTLTDKPERFFVSEIIREKIFNNYKKEVPYSTEVVVSEFFEDDNIIRIRAEIYVERKSQKGIIIGKGGLALKKVGIESRKDMETFFGKQIHLETYVKVADDWRKKSLALKRFGYNQ